MIPKARLDEALQKQKALQKQLDDIIKSATELKQKMGEKEFNVAAWIQDHIAVAENNLDQANTSYHEYGQEEKPVAPDAGAM